MSSNGAFEMTRQEMIIFERIDMPTRFEHYSHLKSVSKCWKVREKDTIYFAMYTKLGNLEHIRIFREEIDTGVYDGYHLD